MPTSLPELLRLLLDAHNERVPDRQPLLPHHPGYLGAETQSPDAVQALEAYKPGLPSAFQCACELIAAKSSLFGVNMERAIKAYLLERRYAGFDLANLTVGDIRKSAVPLAELWKAAPLGGVRTPTPLAAEIDKFDQAGYGDELAAALARVRPDEMKPIMAKLRELSNATLTPAAPPVPAEPPVDALAALRDFAQRELKGKERRVVELLCERDGECPIADLASDSAILWSSPFDDTYNAMQSRLNKKLKKRGWKLSRQANTSRLNQTDESSTKKS